MIPDLSKKFEAVSLLQPVCTIVKFRVDIHVAVTFISLSVLSKKILPFILLHSISSKLHLMVI